jgi:hypothetical protein
LAGGHHCLSFGEFEVRPLGRLGGTVRVHRCNPSRLYQLS